MNAQPRLESRVSATEHMQVILHAQIEELAIDNRTNHAQTTEDLRKINNHLEDVDTRFDQIDARLDKIKSTMATKDDIANIATKDDIANMATKDDLARLRDQIVEAFSQAMDQHILRYHQS